MDYFNEQTTEEEFAMWVQTTTPGDIAKLEKGFEYETFLERLKPHIEDNRTLDVFYCHAGHVLHTEYGPNTVVVAVNEVN